MTKNPVYDALAQKVAARPAGWGQPQGRGQRHAHRYAAGDMLSACGRVLYFGETTTAPGRTKKCPTCWRAELEGTTP